MITEVYPIGSLLSAPNKAQVHAGIGDDLFQQVEPLLLEKSYRLIGKGGFGSAWLAKDKAHVLKVTPRADKGYIAYAEFCQKHPSLHLPKILDTAYSTTTNPPCFLVKLELLWRAPESVEWGCLPTVLHTLMQGRASLVDALLGDKPLTMWPHIMKVNRCEERAKKLPPSLLKTLAVVVEKGKKTFGIDLPWTNIGRRKDGTLVITDPWHPVRLPFDVIYDYRKKERQDKRLSQATLANKRDTRNLSCHVKNDVESR